MFRPYESKRAFEDVAGQIQEAILSGRLKEGERLPSERALAEQFEAARLTVREALRTLETKGFIRIRKGSGGGAYIEVGNRENVAAIIVDNLTLEGLAEWEITEARIGLECTVVRSVISRGTPKDLSRIARDLDESKLITEHDDPKVTVSKMISFHILLSEASHNLPHILFIRSLMEWARRKLLHYVPTSNQIIYSYQAHKDIFEAIESKDSRRAQRLMKKHIERMGSFVRTSSSSRGRHPTRRRPGELNDRGLSNLSGNR